MKKLTIFFTIFMLATAAFSQARITSTEYQKTIQPAVESEYPYSETTVSKAIDDKLQKLGFKGKESNGYMIYKGVRMSELGPDSYDLYIKTDRKSKKEKDVAVVTMMISSGNDVFFRDNTSPVFTNAKNFLDSQVLSIAAYDLEQQIVLQDSEVKKSSKKMKNLEEEAEDLQNKRKKIEKEIEENLKEQENQKAEMVKQGDLLNGLISKRKQ